MATRPAQGTSSTPKQVRKPPFADWPTIKILNPPTGRFSPHKDQICFTYCSQSIYGRGHAKHPFCRSICFRKVFPHEVKNVASFKAHQNTNAEGEAKYLLPAEGQTEHIPRIFGGKRKHVPDEDDDEDDYEQPPLEPKHWQTGWYMWTASSYSAMAEQYNTMGMDLAQQQARQREREQMKDLWQDYQDYLRQHPDGPQPLPDGSAHRYWGPKQPPRPYNGPAPSESSMLVAVPPEFPPVWERIEKLLAPVGKVLSTTRTSLESGEHIEFARRLWEKGRSNEPFILAGKTLEKAIELYKHSGSSDGDDD